MKLIARGELNLSSPQVMGILNVTPDSFSDGGTHNSLNDAINHAAKLIAEGLLSSISVVNQQGRVPVMFLSMKSFVVLFLWSKLSSNVLMCGFLLIHQSTSDHGVRSSGCLYYQ